MNWNLLKFSLPFAFLMLIVSCGDAQQSNQQTHSKATAENISPEKFREMTMKMENITLLDVRSDKECGEGMIEGAIQMNYYDKDFKSQLESLPKDKPVLVYCAVGGRSGSAVQMLHSAGIQTVYNMDGGIDAWRKKGYPTVKK